MFRRVAGFALAVVMLAALCVVVFPEAVAADMEDDNSAVAKAVASSNHLLIMRKDKNKTIWGKTIAGDDDWVMVATGVTDIAAGDTFFIAVKDGKVYRWNPASEAFPESPYNDLDNVKKVFAGGDRTYAVTGNSSNGLYAWGATSNDEIYLGNDSQGGSATPVSINQNGTIVGSITSVAIGENHVLALADGKLYAWGSRSNGRLGLGDSSIVTGPIRSPQRVGSYSNVTSIAAGSAHSLAVIGGEVFVWGQAFSGQLGGISDADIWVPTFLTSTYDFINANIIKVAAGGVYSVAVSNYGSNTGALFEWGNKAPGFSTPLENSGLSEVKDVFTNGISFFAIARDALFIWSIGEDPVEIPWDIADTILGPGEGTTYKGICPTIDLSMETIDFSDTDFQLRAYSINGGKVWIEYTGSYAAGKNPLKDTFPKLLDKGLKLWLASEYNKSVKPDPTNIAGVEYIKFDALNERPIIPKDIKPAVMYSEGDSSDRTFVMATKVTYKEDRKTITELDELDDDFECTIQAVNGKDKYPDGESWKPLSEWELEIPTTKPAPVYYIRLAPTYDTPASKPVKITPAVYSKAPSYKVNYKTETLKIGVGSLYAVVGPDWNGDYEKVIWLDNHLDENDRGKVISIPINISPYILSGQIMLVKNPAKDYKKPGSETQIIKFAERSQIETTELECANGKMTLDKKKYEVYNAATGKWGSVPKVTSNFNFTIRLKPTAKLTKGVLSGNAASALGTLAITWGEYTDAKGSTKSGIVGATISP